MRKLFLSIIGLFCLSNLFAIGPIIIPMSTHHGGGSLSDNQMLGVYLAFNTLCLSIIFILSVIWIIRKGVNPNFNTSYWEYCFDLKLDGDYVLAGLTSVFFVYVNALALIVLLAEFFSKNL